MTTESEIAASPSTSIPSSKAEQFFTRPRAFSNKLESTSLPCDNAPKPLSTHPDSKFSSSSHVDDSFLSKPSFLVPENPARREHYEGRFLPAGPSRVPSLDGRFSFNRSSSSRSSSPGGSSSDWSTFHGFMEVGPDARQEWLRMANVTSQNDCGWNLSRESYDRSFGHVYMEKITAGGSQLALPSPRSEICGVCSRTLAQRSPWASSRVMGFHECNVIGVLVCGHTYHTECLEQITPESARQDPACPRCNSDKGMPKNSMISMSTQLKPRSVRGNSFMSRPSPRNKLSRVGVMDDNIGSEKPKFLISSSEEPSP